MAVMRHSLDPLFRPRSVAVFGASATPGSVGNILMRNLLENPFGGVVYPHQPQAPRRAGRPLLSRPRRRARKSRAGRDRHAGGDGAGLVASASNAACPPPSSSRPASPNWAPRAASWKTRSATGPRARCASSVPIASASSIRRATSTPASRRRWPRPAGSPCSARAAPSAPPSSTGRGTHVGFSSFVSVGSMLDVDFADLIDYFADDPATRSIVLYMESIGDVRKFLSAARSVSRTKPVIVVKAGRHEAGARAAASHTGALAGADAVFDAAFRRAGVLRVATIPDLFNMSEILAMQPPPRGPALAIITNAGGPGVMATDALMLAGGQLATAGARDAGRPQRRSAAVLEPRQPDRPARRRHAGALPAGRRSCAPGPQRPGPPDPADAAGHDRPDRDGPASSSRSPPARASRCWPAGWAAAAVRRGIEMLNTAGIPTFDAPEAAIRAFLHMVQYRRNQELLYETPPAPAGSEMRARRRPRCRRIFAAGPRRRPHPADRGGGQGGAGRLRPAGGAGGRLPHGRRGGCRRAADRLIRWCSSCCPTTSRTRAMSAACSSTSPTSRPSAPPSSHPRTT